MQNNKKIMDDYLVITVVILIILLLLCYLSDHKIMGTNNSNNNLVTTQQGNYLSGNAYTAVQNTSTTPIYGGESAKLPNGQTVCNMQRSLMSQYPTDISRKQDYQISLSQKYCDPNIRY